MTSLNVKALLGFAFLAATTGLLVFIPAGTSRYWQAWVFLAAFFTPAGLIGVYLARNDPALERRRLSAGPMAEKTAAQKIIMIVISTGFVGLLAVPAFDHRFGWSHVPVSIVIAGDVLIIVGFAITFLAFRENSFAAATVEIADEHRLVSSGPYALVRHPQYAGAFLYLLGMPLALGSYWGLLVLVPTTAALIWRLFDEESLLAKQLPGYAEYRQRTRWRLIPAIF